MVVVVCCWSRLWILGMFIWRVVVLAGFVFWRFMMMMDDDGDADEINDDDVGDDEEKEEEMKMKDEIVESFIRNFHNGNYDVEFDDVLSSDRGTIIAARPTQASYNKPDNWRERNRLGLEEVRQQLQECIDIVKNSDTSFHLCLTHPINQQLIDDEEPIVWHEPILDEYWDQFEEEIARKKQLGIVTEIGYKGITNVEMKKERLAALLAIFCNGSATNSSTDITFNNANLCGEGIAWLSKLVEVSSKLQYLFLYHNRIDDMDSARCLSRSLKSHTDINHLHLCHCDLGSSPEILSVILQSDVYRISLDNNNIDSLGAVKIAENLDSNPPIHRIDLEHNRLNDDDAILISQALKRNTNLKTICLYSNNFTSIGVKALLTCVFDSSSLNAISESNYTLQQLWLFWKSNNLFGCIYRLLHLDRTEKILLALQHKESLLKYLANIPMVLIPEVLAFPQGRFAIEHQHKHLNIVYSTMRWWNMPMLYSYNCCVKYDTKRKRDN